MAVDARISLATQPVDAVGAVSQGQQLGERFKTQDVREQILNQSAQSNAMSIAQQQGQYMYQLATGLMSKPLDQRAAIVAQQLPFLSEMGFNPADILSQDLTNQGLQSVVTQTQPMMPQQKQADTTLPAGVREFQALTEGLSDEEIMQARRVELGLEPRAVQASPKLVEIGGVKYLQVGTQFFSPTTGAPVEAPVDGQQPTEPAPKPKELTPEAQIQQRAEAEAAVEGAKTEAKETAIRDIEAQDPEVILRQQEAIENRNKSIDSSYKVIGNIDTILSSERLDDIAGVKGALPTIRPKTKDLINTVSQLSSLLTVENLGVMSGVLSESDMKVIKGIANDIGIKFDKDGTVTGFSGSIEGTVKKLRKLKNEIASGLRRNGYGLEGDIATNPQTGERLIFTDFEWKPM